MNTCLENVFPFDLRWSPQDLTDAVPLRLHEMSVFDAGSDAACGRACANSESRARRAGLMHGCLRVAAFHLRFRIG